MSRQPAGPALCTVLAARVLRHDPHYGLSTLFFADGELRVPLVEAPVDAGVTVSIDARDVSIALTRPMDVSITNRLPGTITAIAPLALPFVRVTLSLGTTGLAAVVTAESVDRLGLQAGLPAWAMIKTVAIAEAAAGPGISPPALPTPRPWPAGRKPDPGKR